MPLNNTTQFRVIIAVVLRFITTYPNACLSCFCYRDIQLYKMNNILLSVIVFIFFKYTMILTTRIFSCTNVF